MIEKEQRDQEEKYRKQLEDKAEMAKIQRELLEMAQKYETAQKQRNLSPFDAPNQPVGEIGLGGAVLVKVPKRKANDGERSLTDLHGKNGNLFDTSGMTANEREELIRKKRNMH